MPTHHPGPKEFSEPASRPLGLSAWILKRFSGSWCPFPAAIPARFPSHRNLATPMCVLDPEPGLSAPLSFRPVSCGTKPTTVLLGCIHEAVKRWLSVSAALCASDDHRTFVMVSEVSTALIYGPRSLFACRDFQLAPSTHTVSCGTSSSLWSWSCWVRATNAVLSLRRSRFPPFHLPLPALPSCTHNILREIYRQRCDEI